MSASTQSAYVALYLAMDLSELLVDVLERPYITAGMAAFALLLMMACTSTRGWQRRLGPTWRRLHRVIYAAVGLGLVHYWWLLKDGYTEVFAYTLWYAALLGVRLLLHRYPHITRQSVFAQPRKAD